MTFNTADLCDQHSDNLQISIPGLLDFGGRRQFFGRITTIKCFEDNSRVGELAATRGEGGVIVVDGGASLRCALLGDRLAQLAVENGWSGLVINGCVRDSAILSGLPLGVKALATHPLKSVKRGAGEINVPVSFAQVTFQPGHYLYTDRDGVIVAPYALF